MGFSVSGYVSADIDASGKTARGQVATDTTVHETSIDPSQDTETYDYTEDMNGAEGTPDTTADTAAEGTTTGPGQSGGAEASGYNPASNGGAGSQNQGQSGGPGTGQTGGGGPQGGNTSSSGVGMDSPGGMNNGGTNGSNASLNTDGISNKGGNYEGTSSTTGAGNPTSQGGMGTGQGTEIKVVGTDVTMFTAEDMPDGETFFHEGQAYIITGHNVDGSINAENMTEDFTEQLRNAGIFEEDINRVLNGEITIQELFVEIQNGDLDSKKFKQLMENNMIQSIKNSDKDGAYPFFVFNNMEELNAYLNSAEKEVADLVKERNAADNHELDAAEQIVMLLNQGWSLEDALNHPVAWSYVDADTGETKYVYTDPYADMSYQGNYGSNYMYKSLTFEEMYGDSEYLDQIKQHCYEQTIDHWFSEDEVVHKWDQSDENTREFYLELLDEAANHREERATRLKELDARIEQLVSEIEYCKWVKSYVENEYNYYNNNIRKYTKNEDFSDNCSYDPSITDDLLSKLLNNGTPGYNGITTVYLNDKEDIVKYIIAMANGEVSTSGYITQDGRVYQVVSNNPLLQHYITWLSQRDGEGNIPLSEEEIATINYIYNTSDNPVEDLYKYLDFMNDNEVTLADKLDERWLYRQQELDKEFADKHPWLASIWSVIATPFEGLAAAINSYSAVTQNYKIARCDVYSSGDTMRGQVSYNIGQKYGETWQFVYDTGMSMADSLALIAVTYFTGGAGLAVNTILSATLMGSRAYVSTINEALDRGLTDGQAVLLASTSALVETAMEAYSLGHLFNLEGALGNVTEHLTSRIGKVFTNDAAATFMEKLTFCVAGSISQGICEGEEEFGTELLNTVCDLLIAKDKSKIEQSAAYYQKLGLTDEEIGERLFIDYTGQLWQAFKGGFFSGLVFGAFGSAKTTGLTSYGIANGMYDGNINLDASSSEQFVEALQYNKQQQQAAENVNSGYSLKEVMAQVHNGATIQEALRSLKSGAVYNDAVIQQEKGGNLTEQQMKVLDDYNLIREGLVEQNAKQIGKKEIIRRIESILHGFQAPSLTQIIKETQAEGFEVSLYSGQFRPPENLSSITREQQIYSDALFAMLKTAERLELTRVGSLRQLRAFVEGETNKITTRSNARAILRQYSNSELRTAYERISRNVLNDMNVDVQTAIDDVAQVCKISPYEAARLVESYIKGQQLSDLKFPGNFNYSDLDLIKRKYNVFTPSAGQFDYSILLSSIESYNRVIALQDRMNQAIRQLQGTDRFKTNEDVLAYLTQIGRTGDFMDLSSTIADVNLYNADRFEFARAIERVNNSYFESKQITDVLFNDFWNILNTGTKSDYNAASLLYQTLSISYSRGNEYAAQVIKTVMEIKKRDSNFHLTSQTYGECFFDRSQSRIEIGKNHTAMLDQGTIMHELGHALWRYVSRQTLPVSWNAESQIARGRASNNRQAIRALNQLEQMLKDISEYSHREATIRFENELMQSKRKTLAQYQESLAKSFRLKAMFLEGHTISSFKATLTKLGYSSERISKIVENFKNNGFDADKAAAIIINANISKLSDEIARTQYPDYCALSDIVSAMFYGKDQNGIQRDSNGRELYITYAHGNDYYTNDNKNNNIQTETAVFHEIIANYTQLVLTGTNNTIYYLNHIFGQTFVDMLHGAFTSNIRYNKYIQYAYTINFVKVDEALRIIDEVNNMTSVDLPLRFSNVDIFHEQFIQQLINNGVFNTKVDTKILEKLLENRKFADVLLNTRTDIFDPYLEEAINSRLREGSIFERMKPTDFITYLNHSFKASTILDNITPTQLGNLLSNMGSNIYNWISSPVIRETILNFNAQQLSEFLDKCEGLNLDALSNPYLVQSQWGNLIDDFYGGIKTNFANFDFLSEHSEMAVKLENIIPMNSSIQNCREAFEIVKDFNNMYRRINSLRPGTQDIESNLRIIDDVIRTVSAPLSFGSVQNYKTCFIKTLMKSQIFSQLDNNAINKLISEPIFLNELAGNEKIDILLTLNLDNDIAARAILPSLTKGTQESFNKILNTTAMNQYIQGLNAGELATLIKRMNDSNNWWLANETIVAKITTFNSNEMALFINSLGYINLNDSIINNSNNIAVSTFFDKLIQLSNVSDFESCPQLYTLLDNINKSVRTLPLLGNIELENKISSFINNMNILTYTIKNRILEALPDNLKGDAYIDLYSNVILEVNSTPGYYNVTVEMNGETKTIVTMAPRNSNGKTTVALSRCFDGNDFYEAIANGTFKIIDVSPNVVKETLVINAQQGDGLYQATFVVDGIEYKEIRKSEYGILDFGSKHQTGQTVDLKAVEYLGNYVINTPNDDSIIYRISYTENGASKVIYATSTGGKLDLNEIIANLNTSYMDFSSLNVEQVSNPQELLGGLKSLTDGLFAGEDYGGNQSNPKSYLNSYFRSTGSIFEMDMGSRISDMIESYFPELKTMPTGKAKAYKIRLAKLYASSGCGYMAFANVVTQYLSSLENGPQIFEQAFGIPMQIDGKFTEEFLAISFCMSGISQEVGGQLSNLNTSIIDNLGWRPRYVKYVTQYLAARGIKINAEHFDAGANARQSLLSTLASSPNSFHILTASQFDLERLSVTQQTGENTDAALANATSVGRMKEKVGGHAMLVTEVTPTGEIIVSSWKGKYRFVPESLVKYQKSRSGMFRVDISLAQTQSTQSMATMENGIGSASTEISIDTAQLFENSENSNVQPGTGSTSFAAELLAENNLQAVSGTNLVIAPNKLLIKQGLKIASDKVIAYDTITQEYFRFVPISDNFNPRLGNFDSTQGTWVKIPTEAMDNPTAVGKRFIIDNTKITDLVSGREYTLPTKPLVKGDIITPSITSHLDGEVTQGTRRGVTIKQAGGGHDLTAMRNNPSITIDESKISEYANGVKKGDNGCWAITDVDGTVYTKKTSTFFPESWSREQIENAIMQVLETKPYAVGFRATIYYSQVDGVHIVAAISPDGTMTTAYPLTELDVGSELAKYDRIVYPYERSN